MKIILILHHSLTPFKLKVDPLSYEDDWHVRIATNLKIVKKQLNVECWRPERSLKKTYIRKGKEGIIFRIFPSFYYNIKFELSIQLIKELIKLLKKEKFIIHLHGLYNLHTYLILLIFGRKIPIIVQSHGGFPAYIKYRRRRNAFKIYHLLLSFLEKKVFKFGTLYFCLNKTEEEFFKSKFGKKKVIIQSMGVDFKVFKPLNKDKAVELLNLDKNKSYLLYVGRLSENKGLEYLLFALKDLIKLKKDILLLIIGEGEYKNYLQKIIINLQIQKYVKFIGYVRNIHLPLWYNAVDVVINPSLSESFGVVAIEALACETPFIGTKVGYMPEIIKNFGGGITIPPKNSSEIKNAILTILNNKHIISFNRVDGEVNYSLEKIIKKTLKIYNKIAMRFKIE